MAQTIQQQRAKYALECVTALTGQHHFTKEQQKNFISYANSLPAMIHTNGLGQTMAFHKAKGSNNALNETDDKKRSYNALYKIVSDWLCRPPQVYENYDDVLKGITQEQIQSYQLAQAEALVLMSWVKKFAKAFLAEEESQS
ncbi:type III-B CRISPR module-associated protein Cmr5 [Methylovulum psychrotolerans]|uniref:CRISPR type III-B/RAMP module-associated protein Cmr5 n=1 Tax=Methylovulum psychrotolerans TaxID=1704499 RepID=A0A1Z4BYM1_9GAMM|nr:type III-B CRISPR module-associated protein Cmr5 [Methylovulum psychrotolerans]ASF46386.1 type III-B CRISPR module-associated protein Cmr5 [Methylovulum psychrotolerans]